MKPFALGRWLLVLGAALGVAAPVFAQGTHTEGVHEAHADHEHAEGAHEAHAGHEHAEAAHAAHADHDHAPTFDDINWVYGFLGEKEGVEPSLLWRTPGMPVPFGALALNAAILYSLLFKFGKKPIGDALKSRKLGIMKGMEEAAKMKAEAEASLALYQQKLADIDHDITRIRREMKESGEAESARLLSEAKERRARMERDAHTLIGQELKAARENLTRETVRAAVKSAEVTLRAKVGPSDHERLGDELLASVRASSAQLRGRL